MSATERNGMLKMAELAEASGVSAGTIKHYLREGLLPEPVRTSRNMAYYPPEFVDRIRTIKRLQEERFMPLRLIREVLEQADRPRTPRKEVLERYELPANVLDRLAEIGVLEPTRTGYDADDLKIIEAIVRFRAGGYDEALGFTVYDTLRYRDALQPLVEEEVRVLLERLGGEDPEKVVDIIRAGRELAGQPVEQHPDLLLDERPERVAVAQRVVDREAERLVVAAGAEAHDRVDHGDVVGVVAVGVGREDAELGEPVEDVVGQVHLGARRPRRPLGEQLLDQPERQEALLLQPLDQADPVDVLRRVPGHVAAGADDSLLVAEQALAQVVLDRRRRDPGGVGQLAHLEARARAHARKLPAVTFSGPATAPAALSAAIAASS